MSRTLRRTAAKCDPATICAAAAVLASRGRSADAIASYRLALAIAPTFAKAHNDLAKLLREQGRFEEAICHMKRAMALNPGNAEARSNSGKTLVALEH